MKTKITDARLKKIATLFGFEKIYTGSWKRNRMGCISYIYFFGIDKQCRLTIENTRTLYNRNYIINTEEDILQAFYDWAWYQGQLEIKKTVIRDAQVFLDEAKSLPVLY